MDTQSKTFPGLVLLLWFAGLGAAGQFAKVSVAIPFVQAAWPDAGSALGFLVSLLSFVGILLGLVAGLIAPRIGFRRLLLGGLVLGAVVSAWQSTLPPVPLMLLSRVLEGVSHLTIAVAAPTLITRLSAPKHQPLTMTLWSTFFGVSFVIVAWFGLPLVKEHGIEGLFLAHSAVMAVLAILLYVFLPEFPPEKTDDVPRSFADLIYYHVQVYRSPRIAAPALGWLFYTLTFVSLFAVVPVFVAADMQGRVLSAMPLAGLIVSMTLGVVLLRFVAAVPLIMLGFVLAISVVVLMLLFPDCPWLYVLLIGALGLVQGASFAAIPQLTSTSAEVAHANGAMAQMGNLGNTLGTPVLLTLTGLFGFSGMIGFLLFAYIAGLICHLLLARRRTGADAHHSAGS